MHTNTLEEATLPEQTNEPETPKPPPETSEPPTSPEPEAVLQETQEQEGTALVPTEPEVIEGEFIELEPKVRPEAYTLPEQKPYWLLIPFAIFLCLLFLAGSYLLPLLTPTAAVTIIPVERTITTTTAIQVHSRLLVPLTLSQSITVPATGTMHQKATRASGTITFFNGLYSSQAVASGTILTGNDGVQVITNAPAIIPAANPPYIGQVTISAHAMRVGEAGNIAAGDINQPCCVTAVKAINTTAFTGGQNARDYLVVTSADIQNAASPQQATLLKSEQAALHAQVNPGEALIPPSCTPSTTADHRIGEEAKHVTVTVSETCTSMAYAAHDVDQDATQMITKTAIQRFGTGYISVGDTQVTIAHATITNQARGMATLAVTLDATYVYQISPGETQQLVKLIAGKTKQQAIATLLQFPGIAGVQITIKGGNQTLPQDPTAIRIFVQYRAIS